MRGYLRSRIKDVLEALIRQFDWYTYIFPLRRKKCDMFSHKVFFRNSTSWHLYPLGSGLSHPLLLLDSWVSVHSHFNYNRSPRTPCPDLLRLFAFIRFIRCTYVLPDDIYPIPCPFRWHQLWVMALLRSRLPGRSELDLGMHDHRCRRTLRNWAQRAHLWE